MKVSPIISRRAAGGALSSLLAALAVTGCTSNTPQTPPTSTVVNTTAPPAASTTGGGTATTSGANPSGPDTKINTNAGPGASTGTDTATADAVNTAIVHNKQMTGSRVEAVVTGGVARLNGTVQNQQQKALAGTSASKTQGVSSVINKLTIISTGGAQGASAKPKTVVKVFNHTTVIHDKQLVPVPVPTGGTGSGSDTSGNGAAGNGSTDNGSVGGTGNGANSAAPPNAPAPSGSNP